jgi:hypothetical protein
MNATVLNGLDAVRYLDQLARRGVRVGVGAGLDVFVHRGVLTLWQLIPDGHNDARVGAIVRFLVHVRYSCFRADDCRRAEMIKPSVYALL